MSYYIPSYDDDLQAICFDIGSAISKLGFSGDDAPRAVFPSIVGRPRNPGIMVGMDAKDAFVGDEALAKRGILNNHNPVEYGIPKRWDDYIKLLHHCPYNELKITPEEHPFIVTQPPYMPDKKRELVTETFFEVFNVPFFYLEVDSVLALQASGLTSGVVLDIGYDFTRVCAIYEGSLLPYSVVYENFGAKLFCSRFNEKFNARQKGEAKNELSLLSPGKSQLIRNGGVVCVLDYDSARENFKNHQYAHSYTDYSRANYDQRTVTFDVGYEALLPEMFFTPAKFDLSSCRGVGDMVHSCVGQCPEDLREIVRSKIVCCGSISSTKGFVERLQFELGKKDKRYNVKYAKSSSQYNEVANGGYYYLNERYYSVWIGASIFSSSSSFGNYVVSRRMYDEVGVARVLARKCPNGRHSRSPARGGTIWSTKTHSQFFSEYNKTLAVFILWCSIQEESAVYCVPTEVMFIILEFFPFWEDFIKDDDFTERDEKFGKYLAEYRERNLQWIYNKALLQ